jgi:hypothetical protein
MSDRNWDFLEPDDAKDELLELIEELAELLDGLLDDSPCQYDHHGYCQSHRLHKSPCPHERGKALLSRLSRG